MKKILWLLLIILIGAAPTLADSNVSTDRPGDHPAHEVWAGMQAQGRTMQAAVSAIGPTQAVLRLAPGMHNISADLSITANITLKPERGALLSVAAGKTLRIIGGMEAGNYQVFSGPGAVVFGVGQIVNAAWFGLDGLGQVDNHAALTKAVAATPNNGILEIPQPLYRYALAASVIIVKKILIRGLGFSHSGDYSENWVDGTAFFWTGGAAPMFVLGPVIGTRLENIALDGNGTATYGIYADRLCSGGGRHIAIRNVATSCVWLGSTSSVAGDNASFNVFEQLELVGPNLITLDGYNHNCSVANACHNTFIQTRGSFTGTYGMDLQGCDNNAFYDTFVYRNSGSGYGVRFAAGSTSNYFYHLQAPGGIVGAKSVLVDAGCPGNTIFGYDMSNGQALPEITASGHLSYYSQGLGSYGDYPEKINMAGDILFTTLGGEAVKLEDYNNGNKFKFLLNPSTRRLEIWKADSGTYAKILELSQAGVRISNVDLILDPGDVWPNGIIMQNATKTVTRRARLNDAGNGWIFEKLK
jgi:hypothetical protein